MIFKETGQEDETSYTSSQSDLRELETVRNQDAEFLNQLNKDLNTQLSNSKKSLAGSAKKFLYL